MLIVCLLTGLIKAIRFDKAKKRDFAIYKNSDFELSSDLEVSVDSGFQGIQTLHYKVQLPEKSSKLHPLNESQKQKNTKKHLKQTNRFLSSLFMYSSKNFGKGLNEK